MLRRQFFFLAFWQRAPQHIHGFVDTLPGFLSRFLFLQRDFLRALIAIDAVIHQRVAGVEQFFYFIHSVAFFTAGNVIPGENQVIDDRAGIRPAPEEIIIFKKELWP